VQAEKMFAELLKTGKMILKEAKECKIPGVQGFPTFHSTKTGKHTSGLPSSYEALLADLGESEGYSTAGSGGHMAHHSPQGHGHGPQHGHPYHRDACSSNNAWMDHMKTHDPDPNTNGFNQHCRPHPAKPAWCDSNQQWMSIKRTHDPDPNTNGFNQHCRPQPAKPAWCDSNQQWMSMKGTHDPDPNTNGFNSSCRTHMKPIMCNSNVDWMRMTGTTDPDPHTNGFDAHCTKHPVPHHHPNPKPMWCNSVQDWMRIKGTKDPDPHTNGFDASCRSHLAVDDQWCPPCKSRHQIDTNWCTPNGGPAAPVTSQEWTGVL